METVKIHYLGFGIKTLHQGATLLDAIYHLGAKYGAISYNKGIQDKAIIVFEKRNLILVKPQMKEISKSVFN